MEIWRTDSEELSSLDPGAVIEKHAGKIILR
jgi:hypothetical protein